MCFICGKWVSVPGVYKQRLDSRVDLVSFPDGLSVLGSYTNWSITFMDFYFQGKGQRKWQASMGNDQMVMSHLSLGPRGYVPAGKLELYHIIPSEEKFRGQMKLPDEPQSHIPEPTPAPIAAGPITFGPIPTIPTVGQVSLYRGGAYHFRATWTRF